MRMVEKNMNATYLTQGNASHKFIDNTCQNTKSDLIEITSAILENILLKHLGKLTIRKSWLTPASLFIGTLTAKLTAEFENTFGISAPVWEALFILTIFLTFMWLCFSIFQIIRFWKESSLDSLMLKIKLTDSKEKH